MTEATVDNEGTQEVHRGAASNSASPGAPSAREYRSFLGTAGETHTASFIALRGYVVSLPLTDVGEDVFATDPATSRVIRVQVKTSRRSLPGGGDADEAEIDEEFEGVSDGENESEAGGVEQPAAASGIAEAKPRGRPKSEREQAIFRVTIKRAQLDADIQGLVFVFNLVDGRRFRSFVITQVRLREILSSGGRKIFKKASSKTKGIALTVNADEIATGDVRVGGAGKGATVLTDFENRWDDAFPPTTICTSAGG